MIKHFIYSVKLIVQNNVVGTLEYVTKSFDAEVEIGEFDYYIPYVISNDIVKNDMNKALEDFAIEKGYELSDLQVITTEVSTNDDMVDISFSGNDSDNSYDRDPDIEVEFIPQIYKPDTPQYFRGDYDTDGFIYWQWENVPNCAFRIYDQDNNIVGELGIEQRFFMETIREKGINYTRRVVAFDTDGESEPSEYFTVYIPADLVNDEGVSENRFGYVDIGEITPASVNVGKLSCFKSGIGDKLDLFTTHSSYTTYEKYSFNTIVEGYTINKQKHYTKIPITYKIHAEGVKEVDGVVDGDTDISVKPWPIATVQYSLNSVIFEDIKIDFSWNARVTFQKKNKVITNTDSGLKPGSGGSGGGSGGSGGSGGGNWIGGVGTDENHKWEIEIDGNIYSPNDIIWGPIDGSGSIIINPDGTIKGGLPGDFTIEGTLPNGDKIVIEGEVLPPAFDIPSKDTPIYDKDGVLRPPVVPVPPGESGDGGGTAGGVIPRPDQLPSDDDHDNGGTAPDWGAGRCPCVYVYESTTTKLKFTVGGRLMDNTKAIFDIHKNPAKFDDTVVPPEYIEGCLCCKPTDDTSSIIIDSDGNLSGEHVGRAHVYCTYKGYTFHFHVHVLPLYIRIKPEAHSMRVGEYVNYELYRSSYNDFLDEVKIAATEWSIDSKCTINNDGVANAIKHGEYKVRAKYFRKETETSGIILKPDMEYDYSTSHKPNATDSYFVKLEKKITARVLVNGNLIEEKWLSYKIENTSIATVDDMGVITGIKEGTTKLVATYRGYNIETNVVVIDRVVTIEPTEEYNQTYDFAIYSGDTRQIKVYDDGARVSSSLITFKSISAELSVDNNGLVTGEKIGSGVVVVTYRSNTYEVNVLVLQSTLTAEPDPVTVEVDGDAIVNVFRNGVPVYNYSLEVGDSTYAAVNDVIVTGRVVGTTTLKVTYKDLSCTVGLNVILDPDPDNRYTLLPKGAIRIGDGIDATFTAEKRNNAGAIVPMDMDITWELVGGKDLGELNPVTGEFTSYLTPNIISGSYYKITNLQDPHRVWHGKLLVKAHFKNDLYEFNKIFNTSIAEVNAEFNGISYAGTELWIWRPEIDPENKNTSAKFNMREMSHMFRKLALVDVGQCDVEIYNKDIIEISDDGDVTPLSAGTTRFDVTVFGDTKSATITVHDYVEIVMEDGSPISSYQDVLIPFRVGLKVNNVMEKPDNYTVIADTNTKIENGYDIVGQNTGRAYFKIIYKDKEYSYSVNMSTPIIRVEFDIKKEPEVISPISQKPWPDLYKYERDAKASFKAYINNILIDASDVSIEYDIAYTRKLDRNANVLSATKDCVQRLFFTAKGSKKLAIELEFGSLSLSHNDIEGITVGSTFDLKLVDSYNNPVLPISFNYSADVYAKNFDVFFETLEDKIYGQCCTNSYTYCSVIQGGMRNKLTLIYMPKLDPLLISEEPMLDVLYSKRNSFTSSNDYRPRFYETTIETVPVKNAVAYYMGNSINNNPTINPNRISDDYTDLVSEHRIINYPIYAFRGGTNEVNSIVIAPKKKKSEMTSDDFANITLYNRALFETKAPINKREDGVIRVDGQEFDVNIDYRYIVDIMKSFKSAYGGCPKHDIPSVWANGMIKWANCVIHKDESLTYTSGSFVKSNLLLFKGHTHYASGGYDSYSGSAYSYQLNSNKYPAGNVATNAANITILKDVITAGSDIEYGPIEIQTSATSDEFIGTTRYLYAEDKDNPISILSTKLSNLVLPINTTLRLDKSQVEYAYGEIDEAEIRFGEEVYAAFVLLDDMRFTSTSRGYKSLPIVYKDAKVTANLLYLSSSSPEIIYKDSPKMDISYSVQPQISIDGYNEIHGIPAYRYCKIKSSDPSIVYVSKYNVLTPKNVGTCTITIEFMNSVVKYEFTVIPRRSSYIYSDSRIIGPMEIAMLSLRDENNLPLLSNDLEFVWQVITQDASEYSKLTSNGTTATFMASKYGAYKIRCTFYRNGIVIKSVEEYITVANVSGKMSDIQTASDNDMMLAYSPFVTERTEDETYMIMRKAHNISVISDDYIKMQKTYDIDMVDGYFLKTKDLVYSTSLTIHDSIISKEVSDLMAFAMKDPEVAASPAGTVKIIDNYMISCNRDDAVIEEYDNKLYLTCGAEDAKYTCIHSGRVVLDVEENNNVPLIDLSELTWTNQNGKEYIGSRMPNNKLSYIADREAVDVTDMNNNSYPESILNALPVLIAKLKEPTDIYNENIILDNANAKKTIYFTDMINDIKYQGYKLELLVVRNKGNLAAKDTNDTKIIFGSKKFIKIKQSDDWGIIIECKPDIISIPWKESSAQLYCNINGKEPMRNNGDGLLPYQTIAETFDITGVVSAAYSIEIIDSDGKNITANFENDIMPGVTLVNGDIITFSSTYYELVDVYSKIICSNIESQIFEITDNVEQTIVSDVYNPLLDYRWKNTNFVVTRISSVSNNPNVVVYPVNEEVDFHQVEYAGILKIPYEFKAYILSPSQSCWAPMIHPGYYYINNNEHFLYRNNQPKGEYSNREVNSLKEFFTNVRATIDVPSVEKDIDYSFKLSFPNGDLNKTIIVNEAIELDTGASGTYTSIEYSPTRITDKIRFTVEGSNLDVTTFNYRILEQGVWSNWIYVEPDGVIMSSSKIDSIQLRANINEFYQGVSENELTLWIPTDIPWDNGSSSIINFDTTNGLSQANEYATSTYETGTITLSDALKQFSITINATDLDMQEGNYTLFYCTSSDNVSFSSWIAFDNGQRIERTDKYIKFKLEAGVLFNVIVDGISIWYKTEVMNTSRPTIDDLIISCMAEEWVFGKLIDKTILCSIPMDMGWHNATDKLIKDVIAPDITGNGISSHRIRSVEINTLDTEIDLEYQTDALSVLKARSHTESKGIMATKYFEFDANGFGYATPIPRLGRPICVKSKDKYLKHVTCYDENGNLTLTNKEAFVFDGVMAIALTYHDIDNLVVMHGEETVPIKKMLNNMVYFDAAYKIELGDALIATYSIRDSFCIDYNYDIANQKSKIQVYLDENNKDYQSIEVWYEIDDDGEYYANELEVNPLYNALNSGFIYIANEENVPDKINLYMTDTEFKYGTDEYTYVYAKVVDSLGNPVPNVTIEVQALNGKAEIEKDVTDKFGVCRIKYLPVTKAATIDQLLVTVANTDIVSTKEIKITEAISPVFMIVKPVDGTYVIDNGDSIKISVQVLTDYLEPSKFTPIRIQLLGDNTSNTSARTNEYGYCEFEMRTKINKDLDICRFEITSIGVTEYLDIRMV